MEHSIIYVGLDVHKDTIAVALAEAGLPGEVRQHGKIPSPSLTVVLEKSLCLSMLRARAMALALHRCSDSGMIRQ
jgi:hypothetical protein